MTRSRLGTRATRVIDGAVIDGPVKVLEPAAVGAAESGQSAERPDAVDRAEPDRT